MAEKSINKSNIPNTDGSVDESVKQAIKKYALLNGVSFSGKASPGTVLGKLIGDMPELRSRIKDLMPVINQIISEINNLNVETQMMQLKELAPELLEKKEEKQERVLPNLKNAEDGKVVMRFAPSPSGPLHIGHAYTSSLNSEYCKKYHGKFMIRIEDTNSDNIYTPAYDMIPEDAQWLTKGNVAQVVIQSERMEVYYSYAEKLIKLGGMYICSCDSEAFKEFMNRKEACPCRNLSVEKQLERWEKMFDGYSEGEVVARVKTDVTHKNPAMRDWPAIRINDSVHPRQGKKYRVWPLMNFAVAIDDHEFYVTHTIRAKEHMDNEKRQQFLYDYFSWKMATNIYVGRINFEDMPVSCSKSRKAIEAGEYSGWEDIRLPFLRALKRRGYQPEAFIKYAVDVGVSQNDKKVSKEEFFKTLDAFNKEIIDSKSHRYFFIDNPVKIEVVGAPEKELELDLHSEYKKNGRKFKTNKVFYITKKDYDEILDDKLVRLMDCYNIRKEKNAFIFDSEEYEKYKKEGKKIIHWLPVDDAKNKNITANNVNVEILMPDNTLAKGLAEHSLRAIKVGDIVQFERFGFARCDEMKENKMIFWFAHK
ncbi:MAG: glutamate--tRNA ligase [Nanoarchaeota archaeon]|nr:glutamate--tRNA ligase [Nanoarchaeota archaeon]